MLKAQGQAILFVPKDQLAGEKTNLNEQRDMSGAQEKQESLFPLEGAGHSGGLQGSCEAVQSEN